MWNFWGCYDPLYIYRRATGAFHQHWFLTCVNMLVAISQIFFHVISAYICVGVHVFVLHNKGQDLCLWMCVNLHKTTGALITSAKLIFALASLGFEVALLYLPDVYLPFTHVRRFNLTAAPRRHNCIYGLSRHSHYNSLLTSSSRV